MNKQRYQKLITFGPQLYFLVELAASRLGFSFPEYIRFLAAKEVEKSAGDIEVLGSDDIADVLKAKEDLDKGRFTKVTNNEEFEAYIKSLKNV